MHFFSPLVHVSANEQYSLLEWGRIQHQHCPSFVSINVSAETSFCINKQTSFCFGRVTNSLNSFWTTRHKSLNNLSSGIFFSMIYHKTSPLGPSLLISKHMTCWRVGYVIIRVMQFLTGHQYFELFPLPLSVTPSPQSFCTLGPFFSTRGGGLLY